ncbi:MAG: adenine phosphoribosyltransferase [Chloroflexota bacterium]|nr:adenine phosphoribosyltransferase [Chloroflexota bacterium]MDE2921236.1 adenine phosphoribosyltransferase [Chloroflexota bacterium]
MSLDLTAYIRDIPDFPKPGILFKDITPLLADPAALKAAVHALADPYRDANLVSVAAIESRGFIFAAAVALELGCGFVPLRKPNKLPAATTSATYELEYGTDTIEVHVDAIHPGDRVAIIDDVIATGGTAAAAVELVETLGGNLVGISFLIDLAFLGGTAKIGNYPVHSVITYN